MSSGTPVGSGRYMRQRHSQGYVSGGDDVDDDACSRPHNPFSPREEPFQSWVEIAENVIWIASAIFIVYFGDRHSNFIFLLWQDNRIRRLPLFLGSVGVLLNVGILLYTSIFSWRVRRLDAKWELSSISALPLVTLLGIASFCLFSFALWPIWSFLSIPLVFTLFMACMVIVPHILIRRYMLQNDELRID